MLRFLNPEQRTTVYEILKVKMRDIVESRYDLGNVLQYLSPKQCAAVCVVLKDKVNKIANSGTDFGETLKYLSTEQCTAVYAALEDQTSNTNFVGDVIVLIKDYLKSKTLLLIEGLWRNKALKQTNKWIIDSFKPYKYEDQKTKDKLHLIDGIVNTASGGTKLIFTLSNLMLIIPIKVLIQDPLNFVSTYKEIGHSDISKIVPTFKRFATGAVMILASPLLPLRMIIRCFLTPAEGVSVFANKGLKKVVNHYLKTHHEPESIKMQTFVSQDLEKLPEQIQVKSNKYARHRQRDNDELHKILSKPKLTYYKMKEVKEKIDELSQQDKQRVTA